MILEAVASHDLWIWHAYFGLLGSRYDINMVYTLIGQYLSRVFAILWRGRHNVLLLCFSIVIRSLGHDYLLRFGTALDVICSTGILKHTQNQVLD